MQNAAVSPSLSAFCDGRAARGSTERRHRRSSLVASDWLRVIGSRHPLGEHTEGQGASAPLGAAIELHRQCPSKEAQSHR